MKRIVFTLFSCLAVAKSAAQGTINFTVKNSADALDAKVYGCEGPLSGDGYSAQLYAGPANSAESFLRAVGPVSISALAPALDML